jgi:isocitrate/isopropylmalate dehydrogenase
MKIYSVPIRKLGDILPDEAAMLTGSLGMLPSASLAQGCRTADIYQRNCGELLVTTKEMGDAIASGI